jgi:plastocyanin domain-containing protein
MQGGAYLKVGDMVAEASGTEEQKATESAARPALQTASVTVTAQGFQPDNLSLKAGTPARITFTRTSEQTCATEIVFPDYGIRKALPLNQSVAVTFTPKGAGEIGFACGMNMFRGKVVAR